MFFINHYLIYKVSYIFAQILWNYNSTFPTHPRIVSNQDYYASFRNIGVGMNIPDYFLKELEINDDF